MGTGEYTGSTTGTIGIYSVGMTQLSRPTVRISSDRTRKRVITTKKTRNEERAKGRIEMARESKSRAKRPWTKKELEYLSDHYGILPDDILAQRLDRPVGALKTTVTRKLKGIRRTGAFYTARMLSLILGLKDPKAVALSIRHGWLKATKGPVGAGQTKMWNITEDDIVALLKRRPWLADMNQMEEHYFRSIVREEWKRDPWYSPKQIAPRLGVKSRESVWRYIHKGWLVADKQLGGSEHRGWIIRESAIREFLKNDPRKQYKSEVSRATRIRTNIKLGIPVKLSTTWQVQCPFCREQVTVTAPAWMLGRQVKQAFVASYTRGRCTHGTSCSIQPDCHNSNTTFDFNRMALAGAMR